MVGFTANTTALRNLSAQLFRVADDVSAIRRHLGAIDPGVFSGVVLGSVRDRFEQVLQAQVGDAVDAQTDAWQAGNEISRTADCYASTDQTQSAVFDAKITGSPQIYWNEIPESTDTPAAPYADVNTPQGRLTEPPSYEEEMSWHPSVISDLGNLVSFARGAIKFILGVDPLEAAEEAVAGDWKQVRRIADRFNNVAWAFRDCADNIQAGQNASLRDWTGNAGDGARHYLVQLAYGFYGAYQKNEWLYGQLKDLAEGVFEALGALVEADKEGVGLGEQQAVARDRVGRDRCGH